MITLIDYKAGNLTSVRKAFTHLGQESVVTDDPAQVRDARGSGAARRGPFLYHRAAGQQRRARSRACRRLRAALPFSASAWGCSGSLRARPKHRRHRVSALFEGTASASRPRSKCRTWAGTRFAAPPEGEHSRLLSGVPDDSFVYFTHSYRAPVVAGVSAVTTYGETFAASVERDNVFGVQFHPEKSGDTGLRILKNFCDYADERSAR